MLCIVCVWLLLPFSLSLFLVLVNCFLYTSVSMRSIEQLPEISPSSIAPPLIPETFQLLLLLDLGRREESILDTKKKERDAYFIERITYTHTSSHQVVFVDLNRV